MLVMTAWPQTVAVLVGVLLAVFGVLGFAATGIDGPIAQRRPDQLFWFAANPLQNLVHLGFGVAGIVLSAQLNRARIFGWIMAATFGLIFCYGVITQGAPQSDVLNLNWPDNWLHLALAVLGVLVAVAPARLRRRRV
jgi:Domain of unknown function (DUF4383)